MCVSVCSNVCNKLVFKVDLELFLYLQLMSEAGCACESCSACVIGAERVNGFVGSG